MVERDVALFGLGVDQDGVPLAEGAAAAVLAAQADGGVFPEERAEGEGLGEGPVDGLPGLERLEPGREQPGELGVDREARRERRRASR